MNLGQIIDHVDHVKPNAYDGEEKVMWLNELERLIQTDVLQIRENFRDHVWASAFEGTGIYFPDDKTLSIEAEFEARPGGTVELDDLTTYAANEGTYTVVDSLIVGGVTRLTFAEGTFSATGTTPEAASAKADYSGYTEKMIAPEIWEKIYYTYLEARIDEANGEWGEYANALQLYNAFMAEFVRWYCRLYIDD